MGCVRVEDNLRVQADAVAASPEDKGLLPLVPRQTGRLHTCTAGDTLAAASFREVESLACGMV